MNSREECRSYWQNLIDEQSTSGLSRREFCQQKNIVLSQFVYYYTSLHKRNQKSLLKEQGVLPIQLKTELTVSPTEIKVLLPNGLKVCLPCTDTTQMKRWLEALKSC